MKGSRHICPSSYGLLEETMIFVNCVFALLHVADHRHLSTATERLNHERFCSLELAMLATRRLRARLLIAWESF